MPDRPHCTTCMNWLSMCLCPMQNDAANGWLARGGTLRVIAAAVRQDGTVYAVRQPARHHNVFAMMKRVMGVELKRADQHEQGFVLSDGRFVGRYEANRVAQDASQLLPRPPDNELPEYYPLTSEDVW